MERLRARLDPPTPITETPVARRPAKKTTEKMAVALDDTVPAVEAVEAPETAPEPTREETTEQRVMRLQELLTKRGAITLSIGTGSTQIDGQKVPALHVYVFRGEVRRVPGDEVFAGMPVVFHPDRGIPVAAAG